MRLTGRCAFVRTVPFHSERWHCRRCLMAAHHVRLAGTHEEVSRCATLALSTWPLDLPRSVTSLSQRNSEECTQIGFCAVGEPSLAVCIKSGTELAFEREIECESLLFKRRLGSQVARFHRVNEDRKMGPPRCARTSVRKSCTTHTPSSGPTRHGLAVAGGRAPGGTSSSFVANLRFRNALKICQSEQRCQLAVGGKTHPAQITCAMKPSSEVPNAPSDKSARLLSTGVAGSHRASG